MKKPLQRIAIVGAGAIGGWLGAHLARMGHTVSVYARGQTLQNLRRDGLVLHQEGEIHQHRVLASDQAANLGEQDLIILTLKTPALREVLPHITPMVGPSTRVLSLMNGVPWWFLHGFGGTLAGTRLQVLDPRGELEATIPADQIIGGVVHASCSSDAPGVIRHHFGKGLIIGDPTGAPSSDTQATAQALSAAGFEVTVSEQIQKDIWYKLWGNMTINPISAFTGATTDLILDDPLVLDFVSQVMLEARAIGERIGIPIAQSPADRHQVTRKLGKFKSSMLQDVEAGKPVELDALVGAVLELGQLTGVETPMTQALYGLTRLFAQVQGLYPAPSTPTT